MIRLLADENVHYNIVADLRDKGFDVITAMDAGLAAIEQKWNTLF